MVVVFVVVVVVVVGVVVVVVVEEEFRLKLLHLSFLSYNLSSKKNATHDIELSTRILPRNTRAKNMFYSFIYVIRLDNIRFNHI